MSDSSSVLSLRSSDDEGGNTKFSPIISKKVSIEG